MQSILEDIEKEHPAIQKSDVIVFFQVAEFVTSFQFCKYSASKVRNIIWDMLDLLQYLSNWYTYHCSLISKWLYAVALLTKLSEFHKNKKHDE